MIVLARITQIAQEIPIVPMRFPELSSKCYLRPHFTKIADEPVFGVHHSDSHLANVFFTLNLLAFLIHKAQHLVNEAYRLLRETLLARRTFFNDLKALTRYMVFESWEALFAFMIEGLELDILPPQSWRAILNFELLF